MKFTDASTRSAEMLLSAAFKARVAAEDPTMAQHLPLLSQINLAGFITENSQGGVAKRGANYHITERAYLTGFMLESRAAAFIRHIGITTDKVAVVIPHCDSLDLPAALDLPVTTTIRASKTEITTHLSMALPTEVWNMFRLQARISKSERIVYIACWDTRWGRNASGAKGLFTEVLRCLRRLERIP